MRFTTIVLRNPSHPLIVVTDFLTDGSAVYTTRLSEIAFSLFFSTATIYIRVVISHEL